MLNVLILQLFYSVIYGPVNQPESLDSEMRSSIQILAVYEKEASLIYIVTLGQENIDWHWKR